MSRSTGVTQHDLTERRPCLVCSVEEYKEIVSFKKAFPRETACEGLGGRRKLRELGAYKLVNTDGSDLHPRECLKYRGKIHLPCSHFYDAVILREFLNSSQKKLPIFRNGAHRAKMVNLIFKHGTYAVNAKALLARNFPRPTEEKIFRCEIEAFVNAQLTEELQPNDAQVGGLTAQEGQLEHESLASRMDQVMGDVKQMHENTTQMMLETNTSITANQGSLQVRMGTMEDKMGAMVDLLKQQQQYQGFLQARMGIIEDKMGAMVDLLKQQQQGDHSPWNAPTVIPESLQAFEKVAAVVPKTTGTASKRSSKSTKATRSVVPKTPVTATKRSSKSAKVRSGAVPKMPGTATTRSRSSAKVKASVLE